MGWQQDGAHGAAHRSPDQRLAVRPGWRRQGIGSALLDAAENRLKVLGAARIDAMVLDINDLGQSLWQARGYSRPGDWRRWVKDCNT